MAVYNKDVLEAIKVLDTKIDTLRDEVLLNRSDIDYVKKLKNIATTDEIKKKLEQVEELDGLKKKGIGAMAIISFIWALAFWYISKRIL